jgi:ABC-type phosphate/phosphonate transport system substrate-binding protein
VRLLTYMSPGFPASLFELLGNILDAEVEFEMTMSGPAPGDDPFADGTADLGWICSTSYVDLATRCPEPSIELAGVAWVPDDPDVYGRPVYFGDLVTQPDSGITTFEDLGGKRVGCNDPVSLSGYHSMRFAMRDRGLDEETFTELVFTGGHHTSLDKVVSGELDAAVIDSVVRNGRARIEPAVADLRIIERLGPWPVQPLVARSGLSTEQIDEVRRLLLDAGEREDVKAELEAASLSHLVEVGPDHYAAIRDAMGGPAKRN